MCSESRDLEWGLRVCISNKPSTCASAASRGILSTEREDVLAYSYIKMQNKAHCFDMPLDCIGVTCCGQGMPLIKEDL